jgi:hypothetical protein
MSGQRPGPDDPLAFATGCLNAVVISACIVAAGFLVYLLIFR